MCVLMYLSCVLSRSSEGKGQEEIGGEQFLSEGSMFLDHQRGKSKTETCIYSCRNQLSPPKAVCLTVE